MKQPGMGKMFKRRLGKQDAAEGNTALGLKPEELIPKCPLKLGLGGKFGEVLETSQYVKSHCGGSFGPEPFQMGCICR